MNFKIQQTYPQPPQGISSFNTLTYIPTISSLVLYGQQKQNAALKQQQPKKKIAFKSSKTQTAPATDKVSIFSVENWEWTVQQCKGKIPSSRTNFKTFSMNKCLVLYGGKSGDKLLNDIHALNLETLVWKKLFTFEGPPVENNPLICKLNETTLCLLSTDSIWVLRTDDVKWQLTSNQLPGSVWQKIQLQFGEEILQVVRISDEQILGLSTTKMYRVNIAEKKVMTVTNFSGEGLFQKKGQFLISEAVDQNVIFLKEKLNVFMIKGSELQLICTPQLNVSDIHCAVSVVETVNKIYFMDRKGELYSMLMEFQNDSEGPQTTRIIESPQRRENPIITEEDDGDSSSILLQNGSRVNEISNNSEREIKTTFQGEKVNPKQNMIFKKISPSESEIMIDDESKIEEKEEGELKEKLQTILTHEHLKRRLLEEKINGLESIIKKSQKFVLMLCRYGNPQSKKKHIQQVKNLRQDLEYNLSKQSYYRKEMDSNNIDISKISRKVDLMLETIMN